VPKTWQGTRLVRSCVGSPEDRRGVRPKVRVRLTGRTLRLPRAMGRPPCGGLACGFEERAEYSRGDLRGPDPRRVEGSAWELAVQSSVGLPAPAGGV